MSQESNVTPKVPQRQRGPMGGGPMGGMGMGGEKAKNFKGSFRKLMSYLAPFRIQIFVVIMFAAISTVFTIVGPKILSKATDELTNGIMGKITGKGGEIDFSYIASIMLWLVFLYVVSAIFSYMQGHLMSGVSTNMAYNLRNAIMKKMNKLPFSYYNKTSHGEVLSRITNDVDTLNMTLNQSITQLITSVTSVIGVLIMMLSISWKLTIIAVLILPFRRS